MTTLTETAEVVDYGGAQDGMSLVTDLVLRAVIHNAKSTENKGPGKKIKRNTRKRGR